MKPAGSRRRADATSGAGAKSTAAAGAARPDLMAMLIPSCVQQETVIRQIIQTSKLFEQEGTEEAE